MSIDVNAEEVPLVMEVEDGVEDGISILRPPSVKRHGGGSSLILEREETIPITKSISTAGKLSTHVVVGSATIQAPSNSNPVKRRNKLQQTTAVEMGSLCTFQCDQCDFSATIWNNMRVHLGEHNKKGILNNESFKPRVLDPIKFVVEAKFHNCQMCNEKLLQDQGILAAHVFYSHDLSIYDYKYRRWIKSKEIVVKGAPTGKREKRAYGYRQKQQPTITNATADRVLEEASTTMNKAQEQLALLREDDEYANGELSDSCEYVCPLSFGGVCRKRFFSADSLFIHVRGDHKEIAQKSNFLTFCNSTLSVSDISFKCIRSIFLTLSKFDF